MELNAKFKIGDFLYVKQDIEIWRSRKGDKYRALDLIPVPHQIIGILYDECYAGVQINYKTRVYRDQGQTINTYLEFELTDKLE